jgi:proteasome accessory factor B
VGATGITGPDGTPGWDQLDVPYVSASDFAGELLGYAEAVVVESPAELRAVVRERLAGVLAEGAS